MPQLPQGLGLDLSYTLAGDFERVSDFLQGMGIAVIQAETQAQDLGFPFLEGAQNLGNLLL